MPNKSRSEHHLMLRNLIGAKQRHTGLEYVSVITSWCPFTSTTEWIAVSFALLPSWLAKTEDSLLTQQVSVAEEYWSI